MTSAGIYTRISRDREGTEVGVDRQEADCRALCERLGWDVANVYSDNDTSATSGRVRKDYVRMLAALREGKLDAIVSYSSSRLYRKVRDLTELIDLADERKVKIATVASGDIDLSTADGRMVARLLASIDQGEAERIGERSRRAKADIKAKGGWLGGGSRAYGYERVKGESGKVVRHRIVPKERGILRRAADDILNDRRSLYRICADLNERGVPTSSGGRWQPSRLRAILTSPFHAGRYPDGTSGKWPAIFTEDEHRLLTAKLPRRDGHRQSRVYVLAGIARCAECGKKLLGSTGRYKCMPRNGGCGKVSIGSWPLDQYVWDALWKREGIWENQPQPEQPLPEDDEALTELRRIEARLLEVREAYAAGEIGLDDFRALREELAKRQADAEARIRDREPERRRLDLDGILDLDERWERRELTADEVDELNAFIRDYVERVVISRGEPGRPKAGMDRTPGRTKLTWR